MPAPLIFLAGFALGAVVFGGGFWWLSRYKAKLKADLAVVESTAAQVAKDVKKAGG